MTRNLSECPMRYKRNSGLPYRKSRASNSGVSLLTAFMSLLAQEKELRLIRLSYISPAAPDGGSFPIRFPVAWNGCVLCVLDRPAYCAHPGIHKGLHSLSEMVLDILPFGWNGTDNALEILTGNGSQKCYYRRVDQHRKSLDVPRSADHDEKGKGTGGDQEVL